MERWLNLQEPHYGYHFCTFFRIEVLYFCHHLTTLSPLQQGDNNILFFFFLLFLFNYGNQQTLFFKNSFKYKENLNGKLRILIIFSSSPPPPTKTHQSCPLRIESWNILATIDESTLMCYCYPESTNVLASHSPCCILQLVQ